MKTKYKLLLEIESDGDPLAWNWEEMINHGVADPTDIMYDKVLSVNCVELDGMKIEEETR